MPLDIQYFVKEPITGNMGVIWGLKAGWGRGKGLTGIFSSAALKGLWGSNGEPSLSPRDNIVMMFGGFLLGLQLPCMKLRGAPQTTVRPIFAEIPRRGNALCY